jgi:release factor glutamine methyltransferase
MISFTIAQAISEAAQVLGNSGVPEARREAASLVAHLLNRDRTYVITNADSVLSPSEVLRLRELVERRAAGEPLQYITGHQEFFKLDFEVGPGVLIPRPETELLVEKALELIPAGSRMSFCDIGTGSGCIAISILHERPDTEAIAVDISTRALEIAGRNAARHNVSERITLIESDCFSAIERGRQFSLIVSNPPYVAERVLPNLQREVRDFEPVGALISGPDGLGLIGRLLSEAREFLVSGGHLLFEMGFDQNEAMRKLIDASAWTLVEVLDDLQGIPRMAVLRKV